MMPSLMDQHLVARRLNFGKNVRGKNDGSGPAEFLDERTDLHDLIRVEAAGGLVEDEDVRVVNRWPARGGRCRYRWTCSPMSC